MFPQHPHRWTSKPHRCLSAFLHAPSMTVKSVTGTHVPPARCTKENEALFSTASRRELCHLRQPSICLKSVGHAADSHAESLSGRSLLPNPCPLPAARRGRCLSCLLSDLQTPSEAGRPFSFGHELGWSSCKPFQVVPLCHLVGIRSLPGRILPLPGFMALCLCLTESRGDADRRHKSTASRGQRHTAHEFSIFPKEVSASALSASRIKQNKQNASST